MSLLDHISEGLYHRPAIPFTLSLTAGIVLGEGVPGLAFPALLILLAAAVRLITCLTRKKSLQWAPLLAAMAAGYLSMVPWVSPAHGPGHILNYLDGEYWRIRGTVVDSPIIRYGRTRIILNVYALSREDDTRSVHGRIRLTVMSETDLAPGDRVTFPARLKPLRNFNNPGGFDYRRHMAFKGIHGSTWVKLEKLQSIGIATQSPVNRIIHDLRQQLGQMIDKAGNGDAVDEKAVLKALVFGDRSGIHGGLRDRFNRAGVGHLLAISGLHVGIVAAVAFRCLLWLFSFFPPLLWRGWGQYWAAASTMLVVLTYGVLAGMTPSTQRAVIMVTVFLAALILGRTHDILNTLAVAAMIILVIFPPALFSISFQLSFAAVLVIVYGIEKIGPAVEQSGSMGSRFGRWLLGFFLVSVLAIAGTTPIVLYHFNQTSLVGIAANLFLVPLVGFVAVPLGLVSAVVGVIFEPVATPLFWLCLKILQLALMGLDFFSGLPFAATKTVTPSPLEIALYFLAGWAVLNLRNAKLAPWMLATAMVLAAGDGLYWSYQRFWHMDLKVTAVDVGQGAATLMELPGGRVILYDGGGFSDNRLFDMGQRVVAPMLWRRKIATVDTLVLSHPNADHLNGLIFIARYFNVRELWTNGDVNTTNGYRQLMAVCREKKIVVRQLDAATGKTDIGPVTLTVLHPPAKSLSSSKVINQEYRNNASLVIQATFGETAFLLTGDIMQRAERFMVQQAGGDLASTVLFSPHHGSRTSNSSALIAAVNPDVVVISAGAGNRFGFPHPEVIDRFRTAGCRILNTASRGAISMRSDGKMVHIHSLMGAD